jgi:hypothetical protein
MNVAGIDVSSLQRRRRPPRRRHRRTRRGTASSSTAPTPFERTRSLRGVFPSRSFWEEHGVYLAGIEDPHSRANAHREGARPRHRRRRRDPAARPHGPDSSRPSGSASSSATANATRNVAGRSITASPARLHPAIYRKTRRRLRDRLGRTRTQQHGDPERSSMTHAPPDARPHTRGGAATSRFRRSSSRSR